MTYTVQGELLTAEFTLRDLPETLLFNRAGICENCQEYGWELLIDVDGEEDTGI